MTTKRTQRTILETDKGAFLFIFIGDQLKSYLDYAGSKTLEFQKVVFCWIFEDYLRGGSKPTNLVNHIKSIEFGEFQEDEQAWPVRVGVDLSIETYKKMRRGCKLPPIIGIEK